MKDIEKMNLLEMFDYLCDKINWGESNMDSLAVQCMVKISSGLSEKIEMPIKKEKIPEYGDLMTIDEFKESVYSSCITDYDGHGTLSDGKHMYSGLHPDIQNIKKKEGMTHVVRFNK